MGVCVCVCECVCVSGWVGGWVGASEDVCGCKMYTNGGSEL